MLRLCDCLRIGETVELHCGRGECARKPWQMLSCYRYAPKSTTLGSFTGEDPQLVGS